MREPFEGWRLFQWGAYYKEVEMIPETPKHTTNLVLKTINLLSGNVIQRNI